MKLYNIHGYEFLMYSLKNNISVGFSTGKNNISFNKNLEEGKKNLQNLKEIFDINEVVYLNQVHGTLVQEYRKDANIINVDGDGLITAEQDTIIGVFTADCVPIILVDEEKNVISAIHSGWKGTLNNIVKNGVRAMENNYSCNLNSIKAFIGPHNKSCCYEVSQELIDIFKSSELFKGEVINYERNLDLQKCVEIELIDSGIKKENIISLNLCTYCSQAIKLYSYRKKEESHGRLFSFVFAHELEV
ncbi:MAG: peptidoglycan editing factor PgeF [Clostridium sp.]|uniref:peptidoglycan editing factor PgeF n=1 Tax=Clostridium sp. TaxID=1506 RepID=UPI0030733BFB